MGRRALLVEDDASIATVITAGLEAEAFTVERCDSIAGRDRLLSAGSYDVLLTDVVLTDGDGIASLDAVHRAHPDMPVIILSAQNTLDTAVRATGTGAFEYFPKPFDLDELVRAACQAAASRAAVGGEDAGADLYGGLPLIGRSQPMQDVYRMITRVLRNDLTVLVLGESGTGKELVAEAIHQLGSRKDGPFVAVNTAAIPRELIESELFGHETRLLRALQSGRIRRVGGREEIVIDVRIVAATNRDLAPMIAAGSFREDLYYRLNVVPIHLPPLRERTGDIEPLVGHFLRQASAEGLPSRTFSKEAVALLESQPWRGNVRELRNFVLRAVLLSREERIDVATVRQMLAERSVADAAPAGDFESAIGGWLGKAEPPPGTLYHGALAAFEKPLFEHALRETGGNQLRAAQLLGINRNTLRKRLDDLEIDPERFNNR